jgi:hypothetical protein
MRLLCERKNDNEQRGGIRRLICLCCFWIDHNQVGRTTAGAPRWHFVCSKKCGDHSAEEANTCGEKEEAEAIQTCKDESLLCIDADVYKETFGYGMEG